MGSACPQLCGALQPFQLLYHLSKQQSGELIRLQGREKQLFIEQVKEQKMQEGTLYRLQPDNVNQHKGFLYKAGVAFYQGHIERRQGKNCMDGKGRVYFIQKDIHYLGGFKGNKLEGEGEVTYEHDNLTFNGKWQQDKPVDISFVRSHKHYHIEFLNTTSLDTITVKIWYPTGRVYEGEVSYDPNTQKYSIKGKGKLTMSNRDVLEGTFDRGTLCGEGVYSSQRGTYRGEFRDGKFHGNGSFQYPDGHVLRIYWVENKPNGVGTIKIRGQTHEVYYNYGVRQNIKVSQIQP